MMAIMTAVANPVAAFATVEVPVFDISESMTADSPVTEANAAVTEAGMSGSSPVVEAAESEENASAIGTALEESSPAAVAGSSISESPASSPVIGAGGGASGSSSGSPVVGAGMSGNSPVVGAGMSGNSPVVGAGTSGNSPVVGPGMSGNTAVTETTGQGLPESTNPVPGRIDYFSEQVANPTVAVAEKYTYENLTADLENLKARYGQHLQVNVIGTSLDGRNLYEAILGNPDAEKHVLIHAGIHAREYMTPLLVMKQLEYGLEFYDRGSYDGQPLSAILEQVAVHFVPMVNPDGIAISQFGMDAIRSDQLRQEIQQCYARDLEQGRTSAAFDRYQMYWKANARGVDLNQNFPADWDRAGGCLNPSYASYKGAEPLSEPETRAIANLVNSRKWSATVSYHSMGNIIYWDYPGNRVQQFSGEMAALIEVSTGYRAAGSSGHGGFKDWTQIKDDPIPGVTIETGSVACPLPVSEFADIWNRNKMVWALVACYAKEH